MLERFRIEGFKALRDVILEMTPVHVLIGPNDAGKSSILEALAAFSRSADFPLPTAFSGLWKGRELVWRGADEPRVRFTGDFRDAHGSLGYALECRFDGSERAVRVSEEEYRDEASGDARSIPGQSSKTGVFRGRHGSESLRLDRVYDSLAGAQVYRFSPPMLGLPAAPEAGVRFGMDPTGFGLATCLDDILGDDRERFAALEARFRAFFPEIESIKLAREPAFQAPRNDPKGVLRLGDAVGKGIQFKLRGGTEPLPASQASDGVLLVLAYLAVLHLPEPPRFLLVEEPENGIHPQRLEEVARMIRETVSDQSRTQLLLTTHSPYLLDCFEPEEVTVCVKDEGGAVQTRRLSDCPEVKERRDVFTLGEIWTSRGEEALVGGGRSKEATDG